MDTGGQGRPPGMAFRTGALCSVQGHPTLPVGGGGSSFKVRHIICFKDSQADYVDLSKIEILS